METDTFNNNEPIAESRWSKFARFTRWFTVNVICFRAIRLGSVTLLLGLVISVLQPVQSAAAQAAPPGPFQWSLLDTPIQYGPTNDQNWAFLTTDWDHDGK